MTAAGCWLLVANRARLRITCHCEPGPCASTVPAKQPCGLTVISRAERRRDSDVGLQGGFVARVACSSQ